MRLTLEAAKKLQHGNTLHFERPGNKNGCERWRVNGSVKTWKKDPSRIRVPIKHGLRDYDAITEADFNPNGNAAYRLVGVELVKSGSPCKYCGLEY